MANPLPNEDELYELIEKERLTIHPAIWELLTHHISNDLFVMNLIIGSTILKARDPRSLTKEEAERIQQGIKSIKEFIDKLRKATRKDVGYK